MLRTTFIVKTSVCALAMAIAGVSYAYTYTSPIDIQCSPSSEEARSKEIDGSPDSQYTLTTIGMEVAGEGLVTTWSDHNSIANVNVEAECMPSGREMDMFSDNYLHSPTLICPKGDGVTIRFLSPNHLNPDQYIYHATLTLTRDDPPHHNLNTTQSMPNSVSDNLGVSSSGVMKGLSHFSTGISSS